MTTTKEKVRCPKCGKLTMPKVWSGFNPPVCDNCGYQGENIKVEYRI